MRISKGAFALQRRGRPLPLSQLTRRAESSQLRIRDKGDKDKRKEDKDKR